MQADKFEGFQLAGCMLKSAGVDWKVNVNPRGNNLKFYSALTATVITFFLHLRKVK